MGIEYQFLHTFVLRAQQDHKATKKNRQCYGNSTKYIAQVALCSLLCSKHVPHVLPMSYMIN